MDQDAFEKVIKFYIDNSTLAIETKIDGMNNLISERFKGMDARITALEKDSEDTSTHNISNLQKQLDEKKQTEVTWKNHITAFVFGMIITVAGGFITIFTGLIIFWLTNKK